MATPGFLKNGINFELLVMSYLANNYYLEIALPEQVKLAKELMIHVIGTSYGYSTGFSATIHGRFQMIFNSTLEELYIKICLQNIGLIKRSNAIWLLNGSYEPGTDFYSSNGKQIEAKVYKDFDNMKSWAEKGSEDPTVFHFADYVLCYLINSHESKHWWWLKKVDGVYDVYKDAKFDSLISEYLPDNIPVCTCKLIDDKFIISKNRYCI